ncbi:site-specific integrase [Sinorhizobium meliloti]|uniref:site-specific integrase n=1 Tax=Rhizobium meliloti TaxID=382 RepID=UPI0002DD14A4|nr:site-specific integrase [Sinorhizobium meliloti]MQW16682.1 tyrosine-type recombinase/integrase [Sinorhizobium meliloti]
MKKKRKINPVRDTSATQDRYTEGSEEVVKVPGLIRRGSTYSLRRRVPTDLVEAVGRREIWVSLGTSNYKAAAKKARLEAVRLDIQWDKQREALKIGEPLKSVDTVSEAELRHVVVSDFWASQQEAPLGRVSTEDGRDYLESLEAELGGLEASDPSSLAAVFSHAKAIILERKLPIQVPPDQKFGERSGTVHASPELARLLELLRRSDVEKVKRLIDRLEGGHGDNAFDPFFAGVNSFSEAPNASNGLTLGEAIKRFETDPTRAHLGDTADAKYVVTFRVMKEVIGDDRPLVSITRAECASVQEIIAGLPPNLSKLKAYGDCKTMRAVVAKAAERGDKLMSPGTVRVYTHTLSAFFNWANRKGLLTNNPATRLASANGAADVSRRPFTVDELNKIVGALREWSADVRLPGRYWVPLIAIFSGMRLGEIVSLTVDEVVVRDGAECFVLRRTEGRSLKTPGSERVIPVHPQLNQLGLLQRVATLREQGVKRLFPDLRGKTQHELSDLFQKRFSYWLKRVLLINERGVSFHSFRHGFRDALREAGVPIDATRALGGWARSAAVEERYGQGARVATLARWMAKIEYPGLVLPA